MKPFSLFHPCSKVLLGGALLASIATQFAGCGPNSNDADNTTGAASGGNSAMSSTGGAPNAQLTG
ncbi:MAG: hypothetical protein KY445_09810, partial [Armatimonadetes bacterium]|nr:hypothetical protein [Armatimonadota bacterium]